MDFTNCIFECLSTSCPRVWLILKQMLSTKLAKCSLKYEIENKSILHIIKHTFRVSGTVLNARYTGLK